MLVGGVLRKDFGEWYMGYSSKFNAKIVAEFLALREGLTMTRDFRVSKLEVEKDAKPLIFMLDTL